MIKVQELKTKLLTLDKAKDTLSTTEQLGHTKFETDGTDHVEIKLPLGWNHELSGKPGIAETTASFRIGDTELALTKDAALELTSAIGITKEFATKTPGPLLQPLVNHWLSHGNRQHQLVHSDSLAMAVTRATVNVSGNLALLDTITDAAKKRFGGEVLVDYKFHHDLHKTDIRLIMPGETFLVDSARSDAEGNDPWSVGLALEHSILGEAPLAIHGYLFAWWCTNGAITTQHATARHRRKANETESETLDWLALSVTDVLDDLNQELEALKLLPAVTLKGDIVATVNQIFETFKIPPSARVRVLENLAQHDDLSAYGLMNAITEAANDELLPPGQVAELLRIGGDMPHALTKVCSTCHKF